VTHRLIDTRYTVTIGGICAYVVVRCDVIIRSEVVARPCSRRGVRVSWPPYRYGAELDGVAWRGQRAVQACQCGGVVRDPCSVLAVEDMDWLALITTAAGHGAV